MSRPNVTTVRVQIVNDAVYQALRQYQDGKLLPRGVMVGQLSAELSAIFLAVEQEVTNQFSELESRVT